MVDNEGRLASTVSQGRSIRRRRIVLWSCLCLSAAIGTGILYWARQEPLDRLLRQSRAALAKRDAVTAERLALRVLKRQPDSAQALIIAGRAATGQKRYQAALEYYDRVSPHDRSDAVIARCLAGDVLLKNLRRMTDAERQYRRAFSLDPDNLLPNDRLAHLLALETRAWELIPFQLTLIRERLITPPRLHALAVGDRLYGDAGILEACRRGVPQDPAPLVSMARIDVHERRFDLAKQRLVTAVRTDAGLIEAQVKLGQLLLDHAPQAEFLDWHARLPDDAHRHPGIWSIFGYWAARHGQDQAAARCFWEAVRRDPNRPEANYQLGRLLVSLKLTADAEPFLKRSNALRIYEQLVNDSTPERRRVAAIARETWRSAAKQAESLGLLWEAWGWSFLLRNAGLAVPADDNIFAQLQMRLPGLPLARTAPKANPAAKIDLSGYPLPAWPTTPGTTPASENSPISVTFEDRESEVGIRFAFFNSSDPVIHGLDRMYEMNGGGAAILDFDGDGWPDIYFTQGCRWPPDPDRTDHLDRLFRNTGAGKFEDVTDAAGLAENRYSQGVTVGDFNSDGFPDLYVANIGENRLYRNNGDGTFTDVSRSAGIVGKRWTSSCLIADLNGDGLPDLYDVNYLSGRDLLTRVCRDRSGNAAPCNPKDFKAAQDRFYLNLGDGRFADRTTSAGFRVKNGKGLGILAADFDGSGRLDLFVANDGVPNFFFANRNKTRGGDPRFLESAFPMGLAVNGQGQSEACMGIAAEDFNQDGLLDLFVTNFFNESNTLFLQQPDQLFRDETTVFGLSRDSLNRLSFGTQAIDANLDGRLDLIITNGDIDDHPDPDRDYRMPPQFFLNIGKRFRELPAASLGGWFQGRYRGRGMSRLDWNRDGREDVVVSHLDGPVALVTNTTNPHGHFLAVRLRGILSNRDAIGAVLTLKAGDLKSMRQLTAGDGYQASNERLIIFGLGNRTRIDELTVRWPSGTEQTFSALSADEELILIEGREHPVRRPR